MKAALVCLVLFGAAVAVEQRYKRSLLGNGLLGGHGLGIGLLDASHGATFIGPVSHGATYLGASSPGGVLLGHGADGGLWNGGSLLGAGNGLGWAGLAAPAVAAPVVAAPIAAAPAVGHGGGNIGPTAGEAIIRGPSGTVHSPAITAGLH